MSKENDDMLNKVNTRQQIASLALTHSLLIAGSLKTDRYSFT